MVRACSEDLFYLDRLGRGLPYLIQVVADLEQKGVGFKSLTEKIETGSGTGKLFSYVFLGTGRV